MFCSGKSCFDRNLHGCTFLHQDLLNISRGSRPIKKEKYSTVLKLKEQMHKRLLKKFAVFRSVKSLAPNALPPPLPPPPPHPKGPQGGISHWACPAGVN